MKLWIATGVLFLAYVAALYFDLADPHHKHAWIAAVFGLLWFMAFGAACIRQAWRWLTYRSPRIALHAAAQRRRRELGIR